jgi:DNA polymerase
MFCGYNNHHYDDVIINYIIDYTRTLASLPYWKICQSLFNLSTTIVEDEDGSREKLKRWKYAHYFESMDLLTMQFSQKLRVGLKTMQVTMHYKNVYEYEGDFDQPLPVDKIDEMIAYNINDVESTTELLNRLKEQIDLRLFIEKEHSIDCLSMDSVKMAETFLLEEYSKRSGIPKNVIKEMRSPMDYIPLKDVILPFIKYKNPKLQDVLEDMKKQIVYSKERKGYEKRFVLSNVVYSVGVGGIHSIHTPKIFLPKDDEHIGHADVTSMYPSLLIKYQLGPRHLGKLFCDIFEGIYYERIEAKRTGQKIKNLFLKIVLNSPTGKMQQEVSWMYDPFNVFKIRINGQLILLMLVDRLLELGCEIIQVNTDGVVYRAKNNLKDGIERAIKEVEQITQLGFEVDEYEAFYQYAINDYFGVLKGGEIEEKGMFITKTKLGKGLAPVIIPKAVINYFVNKIPVTETIEKDKDIRDFLMSQAVDKKFKVVHGEKPIQRINRFYASTNGPYLYKVKKNDNPGHHTLINPWGYPEEYDVPEESWSNMLTKSGVTILNKFDDAPIEDRKINYRYYISEAKKIIADFTEQQLELF